QPAVTLQIKALENDLGVRLFDRTGGRISLTGQGEVLLGYANKMANLVSQAERGLGIGSGKVSGELSLSLADQSRWSRNRSNCRSVKDPFWQCRSVYGCAIGEVPDRHRLE